MNGKTGLLVGLMIGLVIASIAVVASLFVTGSAVREKENAAWKAGYEARADHAIGEQKTISSELNQGLVRENARMAESIQTATEKLSELRKVPGLPPAAVKLAGEATTALGEPEAASAEEPVTPMTVTAYDDSIGRLGKPATTWKVTHILVSWSGTQVPTKQPRSKEEARKLIDELWRRYLANPTNDHWRQLQAQHNEDGAPHNVYDSTQSLVDAFVVGGSTTKTGFARIVESEFGYHLIRRES